VTFADSIFREEKRKRHSDLTGATGCGLNALDPGTLIRPDRPRGPGFGGQEHPSPPTWLPPQFSICNQRDVNSWALKGSIKYRKTPTMNHWHNDKHDIVLLDYPHVARRATCHVASSTVPARREAAYGHVVSLIVSSPKAERIVLLLVGWLAEHRCSCNPC
jgi:hypothetical protein